MPESRNTTLLELVARFLGGGEKAVKQRYPETVDFLVIPPTGTNQPPLVWTSQHTTLGGTTSLYTTKQEKILSAYSDPKTVITPVAKSNRNTEINIIVGRDNTADIRIDDSGISKRHAHLKKKDDHLFVKDLDSTNGTYINQCRLMGESTYRISSGQELKFGTITTAYLNLEQLLDLVKLATER